MSSKNRNRDGVVEHRRRDGTVVYSVRFRDAAGRQHQERVGTSAEGWTRARAAQVCVQRRVDVRRDGLRHTVGGPTLHEYVARFLDVHPTVRGLKPTSVEHYRVALARLLPALGERTLAELERRPELIERWSTTELRNGRAPKTVLSTLVALSTLCKRAQRERLIRTNPCDLIDRPRTQEPPIQPLSAQEIAGLVAALRELEARAGEEKDAAYFATVRRMVVVAISTGLRRGELLGLRWGDLDLLTGLVRVERAIVRGKVTTPKTRQSRRTLELGPMARAAVEEQYAASAFTDDDDLVFGHPTLGTPLDPARLGREYMRPALREAGIRESFRPWHDLRHTSLTFSAAVNPGYVVKAQAGHSSMQVTDRYVSLATALLAGAAERSEALLFAADPGPSVQETCRQPGTETVPSDEKGPA